jgi:hypothetical protein
VEVVCVERQNITLSIPKETLKKAKHLAVEKEQSLSGLLTEFIEELVHHDESYRDAQQRQMVVMEKGLDFGLQGKVTCTREELHERN